MVILIFDTESTGFGGKKDDWKPGGNIDKYPHVVQLAWQIADKDGNVIKEVDKTFYPEDYNGNMYEIPKSASDVHGVTTAHALEFGVAYKPVLSEFFEDVKKADVIVTHNGNRFDIPLMIADIIRWGLAERTEDSPAFHALHPDKSLDTMSHPAVKEYVDARNSRGHKKAPNMGELHRKLFNFDFANAHQAIEDVRALAKCFFELIEFDVLKEPLVPVKK